jgi:hypothetical protein
MYFNCAFIIFINKCCPYDLLLMPEKYDMLSKGQENEGCCHWMHVEEKNQVQ